jgi:hypothetical protein
MPYDSATGSSGPAHQTCEYGVPIVYADINDFRDMAAAEEMAISFYKVGDATDLADQFVGVLQSPEQQRRMAEHNFSAAMRMTMFDPLKNGRDVATEISVLAIPGTSFTFAGWRALGIHVRKHRSCWGSKPISGDPAQGGTS